MRQTIISPRRLLLFAVAIVLVPPGVTPRVTMGQATPEGTRRALLVAIDKYLPSRDGQTTVASTAKTKPRRLIVDLDGTNNDVDSMRDVLITRFGFLPENIHILRNAEATHDRILSEARSWLVTTPKAGDVSLFFYAGHGSQVANSKSNEDDKLDETLVPADAKLDKPDVRDKELSRLFNEAVDKHILVTAIFDSCHSGSIGRGIGKPTKLRLVAPAPGDVADPGNFCLTNPAPACPAPPEARGALILSAALDIQSAAEVEVQEEQNAHHGLFTWALVKTLRTMPVNQSVEHLFLGVQALMHNGEYPQTPVLAGIEDRRKAALFGAPTDVSRGMVVAVQSVGADKSVLLQGGRAAGIRKGAELQPIQPTTPITLRVVEEQGLSSTKAEIVEGNVLSIDQGMLFKVTKWAAEPGLALRVYVRPSQMTAAQIVDEGHRISGLTSDLRISWTDDPVAVSGPLSILQRDDRGWQLIAPMKPAAILPAAPPSATSLIPLLPNDKHAKTIVDLPLPLEVSRTLWPVNDAETALIDPQSSIDHADYVLVGRVRSGQPEYAWVRPLMADTDEVASALPACTTWTPLGNDPAALAARLHDIAVRLATIRNWLQLESPPNSGSFPYHLALKRSTSGEIKTQGLAKDGDAFGLVLTLDPAMRPSRVDQRFVYAFAISDDGQSQLLFPSATGGGVENLLPLSLNGAGGLPNEISIGPNPLFMVSPGTDTFILLTTAAKLPDATVLEGEAVRAADRGLIDPLSMLLKRGGSVRSNVTMTTPTDWSIERFTIRTLAASGKHETR